MLSVCFFFTYTTATEIYTLSLHDALPIYLRFTNFSTGSAFADGFRIGVNPTGLDAGVMMLENGHLVMGTRSEEHTSELQSQFHLVCRLLLEKKKKKYPYNFCCMQSACHST